jgi:CMP-2-keto-3-deoxyoctulosonic acid synthetase
VPNVVLLKELELLNVTKRAIAPRRALTALAVGGCCAVLAACGSSASSSASAAASSAASSAAGVASSAAAVASSAAAAASSAVSSALAGTSGVSAADCVIIKQVDSSAISTLVPLQSDTPAQATAALKTYVTQLQADQAKLTSAQGKSVMSAWIAALQKASTQSTADATATITAALAPLGAACP